MRDSKDGASPSVDMAATASGVTAQAKDKSNEKKTGRFMTALRFAR